MPLIIDLHKENISVPWGFRLSGGKDFGAPITIQRINPGSVASRFNLQIGDCISKIDGVSTFGIKHKNAQDMVIKGGTQLQLTICRGNEIPERDPVSITSTYSTSSSKEVKTMENNNFKDLTDNNDASNYIESLNISANNISSNASARLPFQKNSTSAYVYSGKSQPSKYPGHSDNNLSGDIKLTGGPVKLYADPTPFGYQEDQKDGSSVDKMHYIPSETYKLVKDIESGAAENSFNPKTGAGVKTTPIQSKLVDILEKKHATIEYQSRLDNQSKGVNPYGSGDGLQAPFPVNTFQIGRSSLGVAGENNSWRTPTSTNQRQLTASPKLNDLSKSPNKVNPSYNQMSGSSPSGQLERKTNLSHQIVPGFESTGFDGKNKIPICNVCNSEVRGAYIMALNKVWCPDHFLCSNPSCRVKLADTGFVEEDGQVFCKEDYENYFAPRCAKCQGAIVGTTVKAMNNTYHQDCFACKHCGQAIKGGSFHLHEGNIYCDKDFSAMFSTKCNGCQFPIEVGDTWIEALGQNWHGDCFICTVCKGDLQNQAFVGRAGKPYCKEHARP